MNSEVHSRRRPMSRILRERADGEVEVGYVELFFDLVYVFAIIQISHFWLEHDTGWGFAEGFLLFLALWWPWNLTAWAMNWIDPDNGRVRGLLVFLMLCALGMAVAVPEAFGDRGLLFAGSYVALQLVRSGFMVAVLRGQTMGLNYLQLGLWGAISSPLWIGGAFIEGHGRLWVWGAALFVDYAAPWFGFWLPKLGARPLSDWSLKLEHLAERNRLVFIIALGESVLLLGSSLTALELTSSVVFAGLLGFAGIVLTWWIYFARMPHLSDFDDAAQANLGRGGFAYAHAAMVGGAILSAVGIERTLHEAAAHESHGVTNLFVAAVIGGAVLFLAGNTIFRATAEGTTHLLAVLAVVVLVLLGAVAMSTSVFSPLGLSICTAVVLLVLAVANAAASRTTHP